MASERADECLWTRMAAPVEPVAEALFVPRVGSGGCLGSDGNKVWEALANARQSLGVFGVCNLHKLSAVTQKHSWVAAKAPNTRERQVGAPAVTECHVRVGTGWRSEQARMAGVRFLPAVCTTFQG